ncbi:MAG: hypothetical protein M1400_01130, partial [Patescibacteria group bacterium]|nr:hypothetical protein [Patescibacteria group bacterium]
MDSAIINTDGGARGNPGPAGIGAVFTAPDGKILYEFKAYIGEATNNVAEYGYFLSSLHRLPYPCHRLGHILKQK